MRSTMILAAVLAAAFGAAAQHRPQRPIVKARPGGAPVVVVGSGDARTLDERAPCSGTVTTNCIQARDAQGNLPVGSTPPADAPAGSVGAAGVVYGLAAKFGAVETNSRMVFDGDSLMCSTGGTHQWAEDVIPTSDSYSRYRVCAAGRRITEARDGGWARVDTKYAPGARRNVALIWAGTNDIANGVPAASTFAALEAYCRGRRKAGFWVIVMTMISRQSWEPQKNEYNALIRAGWPSFADAIADVAANANLGADGAWANSTYFADSVHLNDTGYAIVTGIVRTTVDLLAATTQNFLTQKFICDQAGACNGATGKMWDASGKFYAQDGGATTPSIMFVADTNTGFNRPANDVMGFIAGGVPVLRLTTDGLRWMGSAQPSCDGNNAGLLWYSGHTAGVKDSVAICAADAANSYAWRTIY